MTADELTDLIAESVEAVLELPGNATKAARRDAVRQAVARRERGVQADEPARPRPGPEREPVTVADRPPAARRPSLHDRVSRRWG